MESIEGAFFEAAHSACKPLIELIGSKVAARLSKTVDPEHIELLRECEPFGTRKVRDLAIERGIRPETLWRWLRKAQRRLELSVVQIVPGRACYLTELGRELREESGQLDNAEEYLRGLERLIPGLNMPDWLRIWTHAKCSLELGHVYRDRGGYRSLKLAPKMYRQACAGFMELNDKLAGRWSDPSVACAWIVAAQSLVILDKNAADYDPTNQTRFYRSAMGRLEQVAEEIKHAPEGVARYQERKAENQALLGDLYRRLGQPRQALNMLDQACDSEGSVGDHIGRLRNRGRTYASAGRFREAFADLENAGCRMASLSIEIGIREVHLNVAYCELYAAMKDRSSVVSLAESTLASARRLGLNHQIVRLKAVLSKSR